MVHCNLLAAEEVDSLESSFDAAHARDFMSVDQRIDWMWRWYARKVHTRQLSIRCRRRLVRRSFARW